MVEKWDSLKLRVRLERAKLVRAEEVVVVVVVVVVELLKLKSRSVSEGNREWSSFIIDGGVLLLGA